MDKTERDTFVLENLGLVRMVANKYSEIVKNDPTLDMDDLISIGTIGLIAAYDRFDPNYGTKFSTYAVPTIYGTIARYLKNNMDLIKYPRQAKENYWAIERNGLLGEEPEIIAKKLNKPLEHIKKALKYSEYKYVRSLDYVIYDEGGTPITLGDQIGIYVDMDENLEIESFFNQFNQFDERTRKVIMLRTQGLTQTEIGEMMGISQTHISRILKNAQSKIA